METLGEPLKCPHVERFTYRGYCKECAPELHEAYERDTAYWVLMFEKYKRMTGRDCLDDWVAFEAWVEGLTQ